jgi:hypothetical protein
MKEFYRLEVVSFDDSKFAYCDLPNDTKTADSYPSCPYCPKCGAPIGMRYWLEPRRIILSKPKYGDFVSGQEYLVSEGFKSAYDQSDLKGIKAFIPVEVAKVRYLKKNSPSPSQYYALDLERSYARIDHEKSFITWEMETQDHKKICELCNPFGTVSIEIKGICIDDSNWGGEDIFHLHEMGSTVYASQKFVDFCLEREFTNFNYINTKDYVYPLPLA